MGGSEDVGEPNLTPLLDLVLQLLMFFLIVANFVVEQNNQDISLPVATTAIPIDKDVKNILPLNVDKDGKLVISETDKRESEVTIRGYIKDQYDFMARNPEIKVKDTFVVIRGDNRTDFQNIHRVMRAAKEAGFVNVQLRANRFAPGGR
jgi:biopolymer transport protein ExbD